MSILSGIIISFDFGLKRIGTAIGQAVTKTARPLSVLPAKAGVPNWGSVDQLIAAWSPAMLIVGVPLNMDGTAQPMTNHAKQFAAALRERYALPVEEVDERLTTKAAREHLFAEGGYAALQGGQVDCMAATLMLESWFRER